MAKMAIGSDDRGPFVRITGDQYDPRTEPDENYGNFRFNSRFEPGRFDHAITIPSQKIAGWHDHKGKDVPEAVYILPEHYRGDKGYPIGWFFMATRPWVAHYEYEEAHNRSRFYLVFGKTPYIRGKTSGRIIYGSNRLADYGEPVMCDFYLTDKHGWNYPNWMRSFRHKFAFIGLDNEWGSVASWSTTYRTTPTDDDYYIAGGHSNVWRVQSVQGHLEGYKCTFIVTPLPLSGPGVRKFLAQPSKSKGQRVVEIDNKGIRVARPGFDTRTASGDQLIIGGKKHPMPVYMARRTRISAGQTLRIALPSWVPGDAKVLMQWNVKGQPRRLPPVWQRPRKYNIAIELRWKIVDKTLIIENQAPFDYNIAFIVVSRRPSMDPLGGPAIRQGIEGGEKFIRITQEDGRMAADSRWSYLPIIKAGTIQPDADGSAKVFFPGQGYVPFVWYSCRIGDTYYGPRMFQGTNDRFDPWTNIATITKNSVTFESFYRPVSKIGHFTYYIFAIPDVQAA